MFNPAAAELFHFVLTLVLVDVTIEDIAISLNAIAAAFHSSMVFLSGHDSTLVPIMAALKIYDDVWPPYAR